MNKIDGEIIVQLAKSAFCKALSMSCGEADDECGDRLVYEVVDSAVSIFRKSLIEAVLREKIQK